MIKAGQTSCLTLIYFNQPDQQHKGPLFSLNWYKCYLPLSSDAANNKQDNLLFYHYAEWVINHPRFSALMTGLIMLSFLENRFLAAGLFVVFSIESSVRAVLSRHRQRIRPYKGSLKLKMDTIFLLLDGLATLSLLITVFQWSFPGEEVALLRLVRMVYLLRVLRIFRYFDLQSLLSSPTYGMFISLMILLSFFVEGDFFMFILLFFSAELLVRLVLIRNMRFKSAYARKMEWTFWAVDCAATLAMMPFLQVVAYGQSLRLLRAIRMARPWIVVLRNLKEVFAEGSYMQEINMVLLLLAILSIGGGVVTRFAMGDFDYNRDGLVNALDQDMLAHVWFSFRAFTDPGNTVEFPDSTGLIVFSIVAVVCGVFVFAFFIGIGANIVSALMVKLRNEKLEIANHLVMVGWNTSSPFIVQALQTLSKRKFEKMKIVFLLHEGSLPKGLSSKDGLMFRWTHEIDNARELDRVSISSARQVIISVPDQMQAYKKMAFSFSALMAIRHENPDIYINYAVPGFLPPCLKAYHHPLQVSWDSNGFYDQPTVVLPEADVVANLVKNVMYYRDFDQVMSRLLVPEKHDESSLNAVVWDGELLQQDGVYLLKSAHSDMVVALEVVVKVLFKRGIILIALADAEMHIQSVLGPTQAIKVFSIVGVCLNESRLHGDMEYVVTHADILQHDDMHAEMTELVPLELSHSLNVLIIGSVGFMPLILKRLLQNYDSLNVVVLDDYNASELHSQNEYITRRIAEEEGAQERITIDCQSWDFSDMNILQPHIAGVDRILLSHPSSDTEHAFGTVASLLSHLIALLDETGESPGIFPVLKRRDQALRLQQELEGFEHGHEVHMLVPDEYYGAYVAHSSFHMFTATDPLSYAVSRSMRYVIDDLQSEGGDDDLFNLDALTVCQELPERPMSLFNALMDQGYLWIGFRCNQSCDWESKEYKRMFALFPRENNVHCLRQKQIVMNPFGTPVSTQTWYRMRPYIVELIVIRHEQEAEESLNDIFF